MHDCIEELERHKDTVEGLISSCEALKINLDVGISGMRRELETINNHLARAKNYLQVLEDYKSLKQIQIDLMTTSPAQ